MKDEVRNTDPSWRIFYHSSFILSSSEVQEKNEYETWARTRQMIPILHPFLSSFVLQPFF
jgi:hypothetical protein